MSGDRTPFSVGVIILGGGAIALSVLMSIGFLLPGDWEASATTLVPAPAEAVFAHLDAPEGWRGWTTWPDSGVVRDGPARGSGATLRWDDPELGAGSFQIVLAEAPSRVAYEVDVGEGAMRTSGSLELTPEGAGVRVTWRESGDLGRNPLMGYWALFMDRAQSVELAKGLDRLSEVVTAEAR